MLYYTMYEMFRTKYENIDHRISNFPKPPLTANIFYKHCELPTFSWNRYENWRRCGFVLHCKLPPGTRDTYNRIAHAFGLIRKTSSRKCAPTVYDVEIVSVCMCIEYPQIVWPYSGMGPLVLYFAYIFRRTSTYYIKACRHGSWARYGWWKWVGRS